MQTDQREDANALLRSYLRYAESKRPDLAAIEDPVKREDEILKWMEEMEEPEKLLFGFCEDNPNNNVGVMSEKVKKETEDALNRMDEVKNLPVEDTIWLIEEFLDLKDEDGQSFRVLTINDKNNYVLGTRNAYAHETTFANQCRELLCICTLHPMVGLPRRPLKVTFKDPASAEKAVGLDVSDLGITYMYAGMEQAPEPEPVRMRECCVCRLRGSKDLFKKCSSCQAVLYCSKTCQKKDWSQKGPLAAHCHKYWCKKMKAYMSKADELRNFPFTFAAETTSEDFDAIKYRQFLERNGVYGQGAWRRECQQPSHQHKDCPCLIPFGELPKADDLIVLPVESTILDDSPESLVEGLRCWESYYKWRGFRMDSPIAILLHWPLTMFYIIKYCLPNDSPDWWEDLDEGNLLVDIVGVEKEVEMLSIFKELGYLLPDLTIDIQMYGNEISKNMDGEIYKEGNVKIEVIRGLYHRKSSTARKPHVAIGFNAGLGAYQHWSQTLVKLRTQKTPAYFTDYCQYSCECARSPVEGLGLGTISDPIINPFRNPIRKLATENDMPWYSNGFMYHLIYP
ncbi:zinc finger MYND domain-containing protein 15-like [Mercenaria mercenaria]|uniref:zinc finger MYND domain-containing protein 15-like n=1 Tax=Mercenaria mercenaria TaxID=6596 RepID=UPI00234E82F8|nr:zinc finger MYND domain-containing protein 15-like [Mercenaria mercenaria]